MAWRGSLSRSLMSTARASAFRSSPSLSAPFASVLLHSPALASNPAASPSPTPGPKFQILCFQPLIGTLGELGCAQSLMPLHSVVAGVRLTSHLAVNVRACCELFHGT
ncbi:hypothetical protein Pfo_004810 [Paulownia fortunei]|nr:hypothetical protein Pfo_004810 [Paulownia fortunei]